MHIMGAAFTYLLKDGKAYLVGMLNHDSFVDRSPPNSDPSKRIFSYTIDIAPQFRTFKRAQETAPFKDFRFPIEAVLDANGQSYPTFDADKEDILLNQHQFSGEILVHKVIYDDHFKPSGYIYFQFTVFEGLIHLDEHEIEVKRSIHQKDIIERGIFPQ